MGVIIPVGYGQVRLVFEIISLGRQVVMTHGAQLQGISAPSAAATIYTNASQTGSVAAAGAMSPEYAFLGVQVTRMEASGPVLGEFFDTIVGSGSSGSMPPNSSVLVRKSTGFGGRSGRGRMFQPPYYPPETNVGPDGVIAAGNMAVLQPRYDAYLAAMSADSIPIVLLHSSPGLEPYEVLALSVQPMVATQRRRLRR
jgi:hypothetical protein